MKIVSLLPSATEIVYELGLQHHLEAVTSECDYPPEAKSKPVVSRTALENLEGATPGEIDRAVAGNLSADQPLYVLDEAKIAEIQPDLILTQDLCRVCAVPAGQLNMAMAKLGCSSEVISLDPHTLEDVIEGIRMVGRATGRAAEADALATALINRIAKVRRKALGLPPVRVFALEWADPPYSAGHWVPEMIEIAGGKSLLAEPARPSRRLLWREIAAADPEAIIFMPCGYAVEEAVRQACQLFQIPEFNLTQASKMGRVFAVDATSHFSRPGPRLVDGVEILASILHPAMFAASKGPFLQLRT